MIIILLRTIRHEDAVTIRSVQYFDQDGAFCEACKKVKETSC